MASVSAPRSGCAVVSGAFLIAVGALALAHNFLGYVGISPIRVGARALVWFGAYWPLLLVGWGIYKVWGRFAHPERARVTAAEIVILVWVLVAGLAVRGTQHAMDELAVHVSADDVASVFGSDLLGPPHRAVETASFDLGGATGLVVDNAHGRVAIVGSDTDDIEVTLTKQIHSFSDSDAERALSRVTLELTPGGAGDEATLTTTGRDQERSVVTDLELRVPRSLSVKVTNRRGAVRVEDLKAPATITTSHGNVDVSNVSSGVDARTSHAGIRLENIAGTVVAKNEHGMVRATSIDGDVSATTEHSSIAVEDITGNAALVTEHGSVHATNVAGVIDIGSPYSEVSVERAGNNVTIASSHRPVFVQDVGGRLDVVSRYARIVVRGVNEDVSVENLNRAVSIADVAESVTVSGEKCAVDVDAVAGGVTIQTSYDDIRVSDFGSTLDIRASNANVEVRASRLAGAVNVETTRGDVGFAMPQAASAQVTAQTQRGELVSVFPEITSSGNGGTGVQRWDGSIGSSTHPVTIVTSYGDISFTRAEPK